MDKSAVDHIQKTANIPAILDQLANVGVSGPVAIVPHDFKVESLEGYMEHASRYRMKFETTNIDDFVKYNEAFDVEGATCFVDAESMKAKTIFDLGDTAKPGHKSHSASIQLKKNAAFRAMLKHGDERLGQKQVADFLEDWDASITVTGKSGEDMTPRAAASIIRDISIEAARTMNSQVDDFSESMSAMEKIEAKAKGDLPAFIKFTCTPYPCLTERTFVMRVSILTGSEKPVLTLRVLKLEQIEEEIAIEFKDKLAENLKEATIKVYLGDC